MAVGVAGNRAGLSGPTCCAGGWGGGGLQHVVNPWQKTGGSLFLAVLSVCVVFEGGGGIYSTEKLRLGECNMFRP